MTTKKWQRAFLRHGTTPRYLFPRSGSRPRYGLVERGFAMSSADYQRGIYQIMEYEGLMARIGVEGNTLVQEMSNRTFRSWCRRPKGWRRQDCIWCRSEDTRGADDDSPLVSGHERR